MALWEGVKGATHILVLRGDITQAEAEVITNAANEDLLHGGGVAGAIRDACGKAIQTECDRHRAEHGRVPTGQVVVTGAGKLRYKAVIHAVGPVYDERSKDSEEKLAETVGNVLKCAEERKFESVAIPAISSGIFGFPKPLCALVFCRVINEYLEKNPETCMKKIVLINIDSYTVRRYAGGTV